MNDVILLFILESVWEIWGQALCRGGGHHCNEQQGATHILHYHDDIDNYTGKW